MPPKPSAPRAFYDELIRQMPAGLERAMLRVLSAHIGKAEAVAKPDLLANLERLGFAVHERQARQAIEDLRNAGHLIGSSSGDGGYYICLTMAEYQDYRREEYSRAEKILARLKAQDERARAVFHGVPSEARQAGLF
jgi:hypothetical protein